MDMISSQRIEALPNAIYQALNDASVVQQCIPGCETIEKLSDYEMKAIIKLKTGPMKVSSRLMRLGNSLLDLATPRARGLYLTHRGGRSALHHDFCATCGKPASRLSTLNSVSSSTLTWTGTPYTSRRTP